MIGKKRIRKGIYLTTERAVYVENERALILSDLHIGMEESSLVGIRVQTKDMINRINLLSSEFKVEKLVLNGDLKYSFSKEIRQEYEGIRKFVDSLRDFEIIALKGNHDFYLQNIFRDRAEIKEYHYFEDSRVLITHGHKLFNKGQEITIIGNEHPAITFIDELNIRVKVPCYVVFKDLIVTPAFNRLSKGVDMLRANEFLSPYLKQRDVGEAKVYVINENNLLDFGKLKKLKEIFTQ